MIVKNKHHYLSIPPVPPGVSRKTIGLYKRTFLTYDDIAPFVEDIKFIQGATTDEDGFHPVALKIELTPEVPSSPLRPRAIVVEYQGLSEFFGRRTNSQVPMWSATAQYYDGKTLTYSDRSDEFLPKMRAFIKGSSGRGAFFGRYR